MSLDAYHPMQVEALEEVLQEYFPGQDPQELSESESGCYFGKVWVSGKLIVELMARAYELGEEDA